MMPEFLNGKKIFVTKNREDAEKAFASLIDAGAEIIYFPTISIVSKIDEELVKEKLSKAYVYDYLILTSGNAVEIFYEAALKYNPDLSHCKIAAVGQSTAEKCRGLGFYVHLLPEEFSAKGLLKKFSGLDLDGKKILIPGSSLSREDLRLGLTELGAEVEFVPIYDVEEINEEVIHDELKNINLSDGDIFVFTSPSSFKNFIDALKIESIEKYFSNKIICAIGTTTEMAIKEKNIHVNIVPNIFSLAGVAAAIYEFYNVSSDIA